MADTIEVDRYALIADGTAKEIGYGYYVRATDYDALAAKLAEVEASSQGWIDAAVEQQVRRKRAEARLLEVEAEAERDAVLAEAERVARYESDIAQQALDRMSAAEAALPAVYQLALADTYLSRDVPPDPTAAELMARINEREKE